MDNRRDADVRRRSMADNRRTIADVVLIADGVLITHYGFLVTSFRPLTVGTQATRPTRARSFAGANRKNILHTRARDKEAPLQLRVRMTDLHW